MRKRHNQYCSSPSFQIFSTSLRKNVRVKNMLMSTKFLEGKQLYLCIGTNKVINKKIKKMTHPTYFAIKGITCSGKTTVMGWMGDLL